MDKQANNINNGLYQVALVTKNNAQTMYFVHSDRLLHQDTEDDYNLIAQSFGIELNKELGDTMQIFTAGTPEKFKWKKI